MFLAKVYISLKPSVNDPQGLTIRSGLHQLGFDSALDVRVGKYMEIRVDEGDEAAARERVSEMCRQFAGESDYRGFQVRVGGGLAGQGLSIARLDLRLTGNHEGCPYKAIRQFAVGSGFPLSWE